MSRAPSEELTAQTRKKLIALGVITAVALGGVWYFASRDAEVIGGEILTEARFPAALSVLPDGTIRYGERLTGEIREISPEGELVTESIATVDVGVEGHGGLLGIAVDE